MWRESCSKVWFLVSSGRFFSFDIFVDSKGRRTVSHPSPLDSKIEHDSCLVNKMVWRLIPPPPLSFGEIPDLIKVLFVLVGIFQSTQKSYSSLISSRSSCSIIVELSKETLLKFSFLIVKKCSVSSWKTSVLQNVIQLK